MLVVDPGREAETIERLARIGDDNVAGFLEGGMQAWFTAGLEYKRVLTVDSHEMSELLIAGEYELLHPIANYQKQYQYMKHFIRA